MKFKQAQISFNASIIALIVYVAGVTIIEFLFLGG